MGNDFCGEGCGPACSCGKFVEIWNNVFMQYNKLPDGSFVMLKQKISPSNTGQGYILRRLIRRVIRLMKMMSLNDNILPHIAETVISLNASVYPELSDNLDFIYDQLEKEFALFSKTLGSGLKVAEKTLSKIKSDECLDGGAAFRLFDTFGFPLELTEELAKEKGISVDVEGFQKHLSEHQEKSRNSAQRLFKGGLADHSEQTA